MTRYLTIETCFKCPRCMENPTPPTAFKIWACAGYGKDAPIRPLSAPASEIPEWCPLPKLEEALKKERERINNALDNIKHTESLQEFFVTIRLCDVRKIVRGATMTDPTPHGRFRDTNNPEMISPPKTAYELFMEKQRRHPEISMWFTGETCPLCRMPIYTDGKTTWCKRGCKNHGDQPGTYAGLQEDYIR